MLEMQACGQEKTEFRLIDGFLTGKGDTGKF